MLNNREWASLFWLAVLAGFLAYKRVLGPILRPFFHALVRPPIVGLIIALSCYTVGLVYVGYRSGIWTTDVLKDTVLWFLVAGLPLVFGISGSAKRGYFAHSAIRSIQVTALLWRFGGVRVFAVLAVAVGIVDALRYGLDVPFVAILNFALVWLAVLELGFLWRDGALTSRRWMPWAMAAVGIAGMAVLTTWFDYPVSMIGLTHAERSNTLPPTLALLALAVWQCGAMLLLQGAANRWLARPRVWLGVVYANSMVMTFYLWNMTAAVLAAVILLPTGLWPQPETLSTAWWWLRLGWVAACAVCLLPFLYVFRWAERPAAPPPPARRGWIGVATSVAGAIAASGGMAIIADQAFPVQGEVVAEPAMGAILLAVGALLLRVNPLSPVLRTSQAV
jgi:hypothetical protein